MSDSATLGYQFIINRNTKDDRYSVWQFDPGSTSLLDQVTTVSPKAAFPRLHDLISIGGYLLEWGPLGGVRQDYSLSYPYRLFKFDPNAEDPLFGIATRMGASGVKTGLWNKQQFWGFLPDFGNPHGSDFGFDSANKLVLLPLNNYVLNYIATAGRGTFSLWNFDPGNSNPLPGFNSSPSYPSPYTPQGGFDEIQKGHTPIPLGDWVLDWEPATGQYAVYSFDPQNAFPLARPVLQRGRWDDITADHRLLAIGDMILDWVPADRTYRLRQFNPALANPLEQIVRTGTLPEGFDADTMLTAVETQIPIDPRRAAVPGTMDFMRTKIKNIVYLILENRSLDHAMGWLYEQGEDGVRVIGPPGPYNGANYKYFNLDASGNEVHLSKYLGGKAAPGEPILFPTQDPYHDHSDVMRQMFFLRPEDYARRLPPNMGGFVVNNGSGEVMQTYTPEQLPVLNGLAKAFASSDEWFSPMPGDTDANRAFALTGSSFCLLNSFQNGDTYLNWPDYPHRPSIWTALFANGVSDWAIYNAVEWTGAPFSYHLFLDGQIPSVDAQVVTAAAASAAVAAGSGTSNSTATPIRPYSQFLADAAAGNLTTFTFLEPVWVSFVGANSYHPGTDLVAGEQRLAEVYNALRSSPQWEETLLVIGFDEHGGLFDHVPPPYAAKPWPNDTNDGFNYDIMGARIPAILVSPWIDAKTIFRSETDVAFDTTSVLATLLTWCGIPRSRWGLGQRTKSAPTFESALTLSSPRTDTPTFAPPYDQGSPPAPVPFTGPLHRIDRMMATRMIAQMTRGKLSTAERKRVTDEILHTATDMASLEVQMLALKHRLR